jgi:hypothetical protein
MPSDVENDGARFIAEQRFRRPRARAGRDRRNDDVGNRLLPRRPARPRSLPARLPRVASSSKYRRRPATPPRRRHQKAADLAEADKRDTLRGGIHRMRAFTHGRTRFRRRMVILSIGMQVLPER